MYLKRRYYRNKRPSVHSGRAIDQGGYDYPEGEFMVDRKRAMPGFKHLLNEKDVYRFISLIPNWDELSEGLNVVILDRGGHDSPMGWYSNGMIALSAWENELSGDFYSDFLDEHQFILDLIGVEYTRKGKYCHVDFDQYTAKAFQLLHIFLHELGHHVDRMDSRSKKQPSRGEQYAEDFANEYAEILFDTYIDHFRL